MARILMVTRPILPPWNEGSKNTAWQIAQQSKQHHFHLMTTQTISQLPSSSSITWHRIYTSQNFVAQQKARLLWHLVQSRSEIDIQHFLFVPTPVTSRLLSGVVRWQRKRSIQTVPSLHSPNLAKEVAQVLFFADRVITISDWTANKLELLGVKNVVRINAGIDLGRFKPVLNRETLRKKYNLPPNNVVVLFSGELSRLGSIEQVLSIIPRVLARNLSVHFVIACPIRLPQDKIALERARQVIRDLNLTTFVHFLGQVDNFPRLLNVCDILLFPVNNMTAKIDTPLTILEAMAAGLPVIISDLAPLNEILKENAGIAVPLSCGIDGFVHAILQLASHKNQYTQMAQTGPRVVQKHYNLQKMIQAYEDLYDQLA